MFGFFKKNKEEMRNLNESKLDESKMDTLLRGENNEESINILQALGIPAFGASIDFISSIIAMMPIKLYKKENKTIEEVADDARLKLLNKNTGDLLDSFQFKKAMVSDYLTYGNAYAYVNREGNILESIHYVEAMSVSVNKNADPIFKRAEIIIGGKRYHEYEIMRIARNSCDGVTGTGIVKQYQLLFASMYNSMKYENRTMKSGTKKGFLKSGEKLGEEVMRQLRAAWKKLTQNMGSDVMVLNKGIEFQEAGVTAAELQLSQNKEINSTDSYAVLAMNNNLFSQKSPTADAYIMTIKTAVLPIVRAFNTAINKFLLLEAEKDTYFFEFDINSVMKAEILERFKAYEIATKNGWLQTDEIRAEENMSPLGIDFVKLGLDSVLFNPKTGDIFTANTGTRTNINNPMPVEGGEGENEN